MAESKNKDDNKNKPGSSKSSIKKPDNTHKKKDEGKKILTNAASSIEAGAGKVGERMSEFTGKTTETAAELYETVKSRLNSIYQAGLKWVDELSQTAQDYVDRYRYNSEMKGLSEERDNLTTELGKEAYATYKMKETTIDNLFRHKAITELISKIDGLDKEIVKTGKRLEKKK